VSVVVVVVVVVVLVVVVVVVVVIIVVVVLLLLHAAMCVLEHHRDTVIESLTCLMIGGAFNVSCAFAFVEVFKFGGFGFFSAFGVFTFPDFVSSASELNLEFVVVSSASRLNFNFVEVSIYIYIYICIYVQDI
jgi:hypothetical protein